MECITITQQVVRERLRNRGIVSVTSLGDTIYLEFEDGRLLTTNRSEMQDCAIAKWGPEGSYQDILDALDGND